MDQRPDDINAPKRQDPCIPVVGPNGEFQEPRCGPLSANVGGALIVYWSVEEQCARLTKFAVDSGYTLYSEICKDEPKYWKAYQQLVKMREQGGAGAEMRGLDLEKFYHPEVFRRRRDSDGRGHRRIDASSILAGLDADDAPEEKAPAAPKEEAVTTRGESRARAPNAPRPRGARPQADADEAGEDAE